MNWRGREGNLEVGDEGVCILMMIGRPEIHRPRIESNPLFLFPLRIPWSLSVVIVKLRQF